MNSILQPLTTTIPLTSKDHEFAKQRFIQYQQYPKKAKQAYLNTLAISAVYFYLRCHNFEADWQDQDSDNLLAQLFVDTADLSIKSQGKSLGKLQCRPILPDANYMYVPVEAWEQKIGFVGVQLDQSLTEATLLGFVPQLETEEVALSELQTLDDLPFYLHNLPAKPIALKEWASDIYGKGWQALDSLSKRVAEEVEQMSQTLLGQQLQPNWATRGVSELRQETDVKSAKLIDLGVKLGHQQIALLVGYKSREDGTERIRVQLHPASGETYLPPNLKLALLSESEEIQVEVPSRGHDNYIQLPAFSCEQGDKFILRITLDDFSFTENFVIN